MLQPIFILYKIHSKTCLYLKGLFDIETAMDSNVLTLFKISFSSLQLIKYSILALVFVSHFQWYHVIINRCFSLYTRKKNMKRWPHLGNNSVFTLSYTVHKYYEWNTIPLNNDTVVLIKPSFSLKHRAQKHLVWKHITNTHFYRLGESQEPSLRSLKAQNSALFCRWNYSL